MLEARNFFLIGSDDQLAAFLEGNAVVAAEALHRSSAGDAVARLQRAGAVIEAGVNDAAVVAGLVGGDAVFFFDDGDVHVREAASDFERGSQSYDACANDEQVDFTVSHMAGL